MNIKSKLFFLVLVIFALSGSQSHAYPEFQDSPQNQCKRLLKKRDAAIIAVMDCWNRHDANRGNLCKDLQAEADKLDKEYKRKCTVRNVKPTVPADDGVVPVF